MTVKFRELDRRPTPLGEISLRRRLEPVLQVDVYEIRLDDEFLMSSLFTVAEMELARMALAELPGRDLDVLVGGLGLGYTAQAALEDPRVRSVHVVEALAEVIEWHRGGLLPLTEPLTSDPRCHLMNGDFFAMLQGGGFNGAPDRFHAILVDIDHSPRHHLDASHGSFYTSAGLDRLRVHLRSGGVFGLWSDDPPDPSFTKVMDDVFAWTKPRVVTFPNHYTGSESASTVYIAGVA